MEEANGNKGYESEKEATLSIWKHGMGMQLISNAMGIMK